MITRRNKITISIFAFQLIIVASDLTPNFLSSLISDVSLNAGNPKKEKAAKKIPENITGKEIIPCAAPPIKEAKKKPIPTVPSFNKNLFFKRIVGFEYIVNKNIHESRKKAVVMLMKKLKMTPPKPVMKTIKSALAEEILPDGRARLLFIGLILSKGISLMSL
jgi:hypothetical protein